MASTTNVLIFGGSGKCARHITTLLLASKTYTVHSIIRNPTQVESLRSLGAHPIVQDIEQATTQELSDTITSTGSTIVIWCAAAGAQDPSRIQSVDNEACIRAMDATCAAGVKRFLTISALDVRDVDRGRDHNDNDNNDHSKSSSDTSMPAWYDDADRAVSERLWGRIGVYLRAKLVADRSLVIDNARRHLEYTIIRPGGMKVEPGKGTVSAGKVHITTTVSREDVAAVVVECVKRNDTAGLVFDVVGGDVRIDEAVAQVVREKINTFDGLY